MTNEGQQAAGLVGRMLPLPQKPKKRGHHPAPTSDEEDVAAIDESRSELGEQPRAPGGKQPLAVAPTGAKRDASSRVSSDKGPARTVYSDHEIDDFLHHVRVEAAIARLDLTHSAVWRWAMHELMERCTPRQVVEHFTQVATAEQGRVGRPRR